MHFQSYEFSTLRQALQDGSLSPQDYFAQLLRLIYRCIFTFSVEERGLIPAQPTAEEAQVDPAAARAKAAGLLLVEVNVQPGRTAE